MSMSQKQRKGELPGNTEDKIKEAARGVFMEKGFAATRTRDIAEASGYNLALINYYFRSKEKLFDIIMLEAVQKFVHSVWHLLEDQATSVKEKVTAVVTHYIDMLKETPGLPFFIMNEINRNPEKLLSKIGVGKDRPLPYIAVQWNELTAGKTNINPIHIFINFISMTVFPFVASPMLRNRTGMSMTQFNELMEERKSLIPAWVGKMLDDMLADDGTKGVPKNKKKKTS